MQGWKVVRVALLMLVIGAVAALSFAGSAGAFVAPDTVSTGSTPPGVTVNPQPSSATIGSGVKAQVTVGAVVTYSCPAVDTTGGANYWEAGGPGHIVCLFRDYTNGCPYSTATGASQNPSDTTCPADAPGSGQGPPATGSVTFSLYNNPSGTGTALYTDTETLGDGGSATSGPFTPGSTGTFYWVVSYSGDATYESSTSSDSGSPVSVTLASPSISTDADSGSVVIGGGTSDGAELSGGYQLSGTVTFNLYDNDSCSDTPVYTSGPEAVSDGFASSGSFAPVSVGYYYWAATYSGDANNNPVSSPCDDDGVTVSKASVKITTLAESGASEPIGDETADQATVIGGDDPSGTLAFSLYDNDSCSGTPLYTSNGLLQDGAAGTFSYTPLALGTYYWSASYPGDANNAAATSSCSSDPVTVTQAIPSVSSEAASASLLVGASTSDVATVSGGDGPSGSVTFNLYANDACSGTPLYTDSKEALSDDGSATSASYTTEAAGTDYWVATYNGDTDNQSTVSSCSADSVTVKSALLTSQTITFKAPAPYVVGVAPVTLTATASSGLQVSYTATGPCSVSGSSLTLSGVGQCDVTASQAGNKTYSPASTVTDDIVIGYGITGFIAPTATTTLKPGSKMTVEFVFRSAAGKAISAATASALAKAGDVRVKLNGPVIQAQTADCSWTASMFKCVINVPSNAETGKTHPYTLTAQESVGAGLRTAPAIGSAKDPLTVYFS